MEAIEGIKIFEVSHLPEWYAGKTLEEAVQKYLDNDIVTREEYNEFEDPFEISEDSANTLIYFDNYYEPATSCQRTFKQQLKLMISRDDIQFPCSFASSEC